MTIGMNAAYEKNASKDIVVFQRMDPMPPSYIASKLASGEVANLRNPLRSMHSAFYQFFFMGPFSLMHSFVTGRPIYTAGVYCQEAGHTVIKDDMRDAGKKRMPLDEAVLFVSGNKLLPDTPEHVQRRNGTLHNQLLRYACRVKVRVPLALEIIHYLCFTYLCY